MTSSTWSLVQLNVKKDSRGQLIPIEFIPDIGFMPKRVFSITGVEDKVMRGNHAHRTCCQVFQSVSGLTNIQLDDGRNSAEVCLTNPGQLLIVPPMHWAKIFLGTFDTVITIFASHEYDPLDYISDYPEFRRELNLDGSRG